MKKVIRPAIAMERVGLKKSAFYKWVQKGVLPPPFKLGKRAAGWLEEEIDEIVAMVAAGRSEEEISVRVRKFVEDRQQGGPKNA